MARLPEFCPLFCLCGPFKTFSTKLRTDIAYFLRLLLDVSFAAMKFEEERRLYRQIKVGVTVHGIHLHVIQQFYPGNRNAALYRQNNTLYRAFNIRERDGGCRNSFGNSI